MRSAGAMGWREAAGWRDRAAKERGKLRRLAHGLDAAMANADA